MGGRSWGSAKRKRVKKLIRKQDYRKICAICKGPLRNNATIDHIIPRCKGGSRHLNNLQLAHQLCNHAKGECTMDEWVSLPEATRLYRYMMAMRQIMSHSNTGTLNVLRSVT